MNSGIKSSNKVDGFILDITLKDDMWILGQLSIKFNFRHKGISILFTKVSVSISFTRVLTSSDGFVTRIEVSVFHQPNVRNAAH
jgi:hypothetical protein